MRSVRESASEKTAGPARAAQYVRMSTEHQQYSTENQMDAMGRYADGRKMQIVRTYSDEAIVDANVGSFADVLVIGTFIHILESPPSTHVVYQDIGVIGASGLDIANQVAQPVPAFNIQTAPF